MVAQAIEDKTELGITPVHISDVDPKAVERASFQTLKKCLGLSSRSGILSVVKFLNQVYLNDYTHYLKLEKIVINCGFSITRQVGGFSSYVSGISFSYEHDSPRFYQDEM